MEDDWSRGIFGSFEPTFGARMIIRSCKSQGFSLPELLVALVSSSLLIIILMKQYMSVKQHYRDIVAHLEQSMDIQLVTDLIRDSVRQAGFTPCLSIDHLSSIDTRTGQSNLRAILIQKQDPAGFQSNHMDGDYGLVLSQTSRSDLLTTKEGSFSMHRPVLIADCFHAEVHTIQSIQSHFGLFEIHLNRPLIFSYAPPIYIGNWYEERYFTQSGMLFYDLGHVDRLTSSIHHFSTRLEGRHRNRLLQVEFQLDNGKTMSFDTMLRMN